MAHITHHRLVALTIVLAIVPMLLPSTPAVARTQVDRIHIQETFEDDPLLFDACGVAADVDVDIRISHKTFDDDPARHRQETQGRVTFTSDHGSVVQVIRHAGVHEVVEVLEELEPDVFLVRVHATANGTLWLEDADGKRLVRDAGTVTFDDVGIWNRATGELIGPLESTVVRVAGPHPLLDESLFFDTICEELAP